MSVELVRTILPDAECTGVGGTRCHGPPHAGRGGGKRRSHVCLSLRRENPLNSADGPEAVQAAETVGDVQPPVGVLLHIPAVVTVQRERWLWSLSLGREEPRSQHSDACAAPVSEAGNPSSLPVGSSRVVSGLCTSPSQAPPTGPPAVCPLPGTRGGGTPSGVLHEAGSSHLAWTEALALRTPAGGSFPSNVRQKEQGPCERPQAHPTRVQGEPAGCRPAPTWGRPGTFWKTWLPGPTGCGEDSRESRAGRLQCCGRLPISACRGGWLACRPHLECGAPAPEGQPRPSVRKKTDGPSSSRPVDLGPGGRGAGPGRPGPPLCIPMHTTAPRQRVSPGRKHRRPPGPHLPPRCAAMAPPGTAAFSAQPQ